jgi:HK97 family phage major capsid protein
MAVYTTTSDVSGLLTEQIGSPIIKPVVENSVALDPRVSTVLTTQEHSFHIPIIDADASASWVAEGAEITPTDPTISELVVTPAKAAGLTVVSRELANDTSPAAQEIVGNGLGRSIAVKIDTAYFGDVSTPAPAGLGAIADDDLNLVYAGETPGNLDAFAEAMSLVEQDGAVITSFIAHPVDALMVQSIKTGTGFNSPLLGTDATNGTARQVFGVPLLVSKHVEQGTIWGLAAARILVVVRQDVEVESDASAFFTSDRIAVRAVMRLGFAYPSPKSIAKISLTDDES